jgi:hypothetical protein
MNRAEFALAVLAIAGLACGGGQAGASGTQSPGGPGSAPSATSASGGPDEPHGKSVQADFHGAMTPIAATNMAGDIAALGLDTKGLPSLAKMDPKVLRKLMKTFTRALGAKCGDCHNEQDFAAPTENKKIADGMWDHFVRDMTAGDGGPVYCDSCHQGRMKMLDRTNKKLLSKWMEDNYVGKLQGKGGKANECGTCHGDPFEPDIFKNIWHAEN